MYCEEHCEKSLELFGEEGKEYQRVHMITPSNYSSPTSVVTETGLGDGSYAVYVKYSDEGSWGKRVAEMKVVFLPDEDECSVCGYFESDCQCDEFNYGNYCYDCGEHEDDCDCCDCGWCEDCMNEEEDDE